MPDSIAICPNCARPISSSATKGLCPACLASSLSELFGEAAGEEAAPRLPLAAPSERLGDYELLDELGRGGMGVVFRARDRRLNRLVALKLILTGQLASEAEVKRFRNEAEAAAQLEHPNIVPIYEVGDSDGRHFFAMKLVEGGTLADAIQNAKLKIQNEEPASRPASRSASSAADPFCIFNFEFFIPLLAKIARAVHHAHQRGILHRDLKPGNILLDATGEPLVADFGLARRVEGDSSLTLSGAALGSPNYMAPEQAAGGSRAVTTAADIYSLGAILYELLAGRPPFVAVTALETMRKVVVEEPVAPWVVRRRANPKSEARNPKEIRNPKPESASAATRLPGSDFGFRPSDLDIICLKCLAKEPARRYATAEALAEDLERWLRHEPIRARPSSVWEHAAKWVRRRPALAGLLGLALAAPAVIIATQLINGAKLTRERDSANRQERAAKASEAVMRLNLYASDMFLTSRALEQGNLALARRTLAAHVPRAGEEDLRGFEWRHYWHRAQGQQERVLAGFSNAVNCVAFSPDGRWLAAGGGNLVQKWNTTNFALAATLRHDPKTIANSLVFSPDGAAICTGDTKGQVRVWLEGLGQLGGSITRGTGWVNIAASASAVGMVAIGERDGTEGGANGAVALYSLSDLLQRNEHGTVLTNSGGLAAMSRDGQWLLTGGGADRVTLHNLKTGDVRVLDNSAGHIGSAALFALALSPDGTRAATSPDNGYGPILYDFRPGKTPSYMGADLGVRIRALAFSPDGGTLAVACFDHTIRLVNTGTGRQTRRLDGHTDQVLAVAFSPDGKTLASAGKDGTVRLWDWTVGTRDKLKNIVPPVSFSPDQRSICGANEQAWPWTVMRHDLTAPERPPEPLFTLHLGDFPDVSPRHNGLLHWLLHGGATARQREQLHQFVASRTNRRDPLSDNDRIVSASSGDGSVVAFPDKDGRVWLWHTLTATGLPDLHSSDGRVQHLALSDDGHTLAMAAGKNNVVSLWDTATGTNLLRLPPRADLVTELVFSPDGRTLAVAGDDTTVQLRDARTGGLQATLAGHDVAVTAMAFSPDGRTLVTMGGDRTKLWHLPTRREVGILSFRPDYLAFSPDGTLLLAVNWRGEAILLRAPHAEGTRPLR